MHSYQTIEKFTLGMGDRFARQGEAQLQAIANAKTLGIDVTPVWNKSNREHTLIGTEPASVLEEARAAVASVGWSGSYHVDADHISIATVDRFIEPSDFFTIDVADFVGKPAAPESVEKFLTRHRPLYRSLSLPGMEASLQIDEAMARRAASKFLRAIEEAGAIYRHIADRKASFITEISVDETDTAQTPAELLLILAMIAAEGIPAQTIAPKFTGRFNKGVEYVGDVAQFEREFDADLSVVTYAVQEFGLPDSLKLSVHSGSDKFSLYPIINRLTKKHDAGLHVKTAGTTWLEEIIGLAESGGEGLTIAREIYAQARDRFEELTGPYSTVIDIDQTKLPSVEEVNGWTTDKYANTLRHAQSHPDYNLHFRQLLHVAFKLAAKMGERYMDALTANREIIARNVTGNLLDRHIRPIFG